MLSKNCLICDKEFFKTPSNSMKYWNEKRRFCSQKCKNKYQTGRKQSEEQIEKKTKYPRFFICIVCGKKIINKRGSKLIKFCSQECHGKNNIGTITGYKKGSIPWNKGTKGMMPPAWNKGLKGFMAGEKCGAWKGGITKLSFQIRNSFENKKWKRDVFERDKYICQDCGDKKGGNLRAHHIKEFAIILKENKIKTIKQARNCIELWNKNNGVTLCRKCHAKRHPKLKFIQ